MPLPADESTLVLFTTYKTIALGHTVSSTRNALSTIRRQHLASGFNIPTPNECFALQEALRGAQRYLSRPTIQKLPMFPSLVSALVASTEWGSPIRCLYLTLWYISLDWHLSFLQSLLFPQVLTFLGVM